MKKIILGLCLLLVAGFARAQGLENLIIEKYYISNAADAAGSAGTLPVGSVTYRFYVDMQGGGYNWQLTFGDAAHPMKFKTTTKFFNNENRGATTPTYTKAQAAGESVMLDSWISSGFACAGQLGVTKAEDNGVATVAHTSILQNADPIAGIPLTVQDGFLPGSVPAATVLPGFDLSAIDATSQFGDSIGTTSSGWSALGGSVGPTATNRVLIAQITTDGTLTYALNIQIGTPGGNTETYFPGGSLPANTASNTNFIRSFLAGSIAPDVHPNVSVTTTNGTNFITGAVVNISAAATDPDGSVDSVAFYVDGVYIGTDITGPAPFTMNWTSTTGTHQLTALATDNVLGQTLSAQYQVVVAPAHQTYGIVGSSNLCQATSFCLPIAAQDPIANVRGYDFVLHYDANRVTPTGVITVSSDLITPSYVDYLTTIDAAHSKMLVSLYFNATAPVNTNFHGIGNIFCAEFSKTANFASVDATAFTADSVQESYVIGVVNKGIDGGNYTTHRDSSFTGSLRFWYDNSPLKYDAAHATQYLRTDVYGVDANCNNQSAIAVQPDFFGNFVYNIGSGADLTIKRDIPGATDVQPVINGFDAFLTRKVLSNDPGYVPTIFNLIAMDVNQDGRISAGDLSQINQRAVLLLPEFQQAWNYDNSGNRIQPLNAAFNSHDWSFIDLTRLSSNPAFSRSTSYPSDDHVGFSKSRVPVAPTCLAIPNATSFSCTFANSETYDGILIGDVNGNYASVGSNGNYRISSNSQVVFDLSKAVVSGGYIDIPVSVISSDAVNTLDFSMQFNQSKLSYVSVTEKVTYLQDHVASYNTTDNTLRFTSNSNQNYDIAAPIVSVRFILNAASIDADDLTSLTGRLNGDLVPAVVNTLATGLADMNAANFVNVYPNPANDVLNVAVSEQATVTMMDMNGQEVIAPVTVNANEKHGINTSNLAPGVYTMKVSNDKFVTVKQVVINK